MCRSPTDEMDTPRPLPDGTSTTYKRRVTHPTDNHTTDRLQHEQDGHAASATDGTSTTYQTESNHQRTTKPRTVSTRKDGHAASLPRHRPDLSNGRVTTQRTNTTTDPSPTRQDGHRASVPDGTVQTYQRTSNHNGQTTTTDRLQHEQDGTRVRYPTARPDYQTDE